jgi:hypothetical protein
METITYEGYTWEPKSLVQYAGNEFSAELSPKSVGNSAGISRRSNSEFHAIGKPISIN